MSQSINGKERKEMYSRSGSFCLGPAFDFGGMAAFVQSWMFVRRTMFDRPAVIYTLPKMLELLTHPHIATEAHPCCYGVRGRTMPRNNQPNFILNFAPSVVLLLEHELLSLLTHYLYEFVP